MPNPVRRAQDPGRVFSRISRALATVVPGQERTMYGPIRDLFREVLGYDAGAVVNEPSVEGGRPDLTVSVPHPGASGRRLTAIIVEAKDEAGVVTDVDRRNALFAEKAKYIGFDTRWFVLVDREAIVARPVRAGALVGGDLIFRWQSAGGLEEFRATFALLSAERSSYEDLLARFREGDESLIASIHLDPDNQRDPVRRQFFDALADVAATLRTATHAALANQQVRMQELRDHFSALSAAYPQVQFISVAPIRITGKPEGPDQTRAFTRARIHTERILNRSPILSRLVFQELPELAARIGADPEREYDRLLDVFAAETANLILARILLVRFFEDHGFFGDKRYVCNGGVEAIRHVMAYFSRSYTLLLRNAYQEAGEFYEAAFAETAFDWVFEDDSDVLSQALEWALFSLSLYDFATVRGDVLSGIYEHFMDAAHRKKFGEYYTPPSIARWMLDQLNLEPGDEVLDPACGSGTFLIEAFELLAGEPHRRGFGTWDEARRTVQNLSGNDLNRFAAVLSQIQLLWHLLPFRDRLLVDGFPDLQVVEGANALTVANLLNSVERFAEISAPRYKAVVGNPPYVRSERQTLVLDRDSQRFYDEAVSAQNNLYALFLYRALQDWCREGGDGISPGTVAFIVPLSIADAKETAHLRALFAPGGRWRIREIVDLEAIGPLIFDAADVVVVVLIAEKRPATADDLVRIRVADARTVRRSEVGARIQFDLDSAPFAELPYASLFAPDGRIRTRLNKSRADILSRLSEAGRLEDAALRYYVQRGERNRLTAASTDPNVRLRPGERWEERIMLTGGLAFRGTYRRAAPGIDVYKGENIVSLGLVGDCPFPSTDISQTDDPSIWRFASLLPEVAYAVPQIEQLPNAVRFDPRAIAFTNTVTLFVPRAELQGYPFDLLLHSRIYRYAYALGYRMGVLFRRRSHLYPENLKQLPWSEQLLAVGGELENLRHRLLDAYALLHRRSAVISELIKSLGLRTLVDVARARRSAVLTWGDFFVDPGYMALVAYISVERGDGERVRISFGSTLFDWIEIQGDSELAEWVSIGFEALRDQTVNRETILSMRIPATAEEAESILRALVELNERDPVSERDTVLNEMDVLIGGALNLTPDEISIIQSDLREDPFLRSLGVREPFTTTRLLGPREQLANPDRYR